MILFTNYQCANLNSKWKQFCSIVLNAVKTKFPCRHNETTMDHCRIRKQQLMNSKLYKTTKSNHMRLQYDADLSYLTERDQSVVHWPLQQLFLWLWTLTWDPDLENSPRQCQTESARYIARLKVILFRSYCPSTEQTCTADQFIYLDH